MIAKRNEQHRYAYIVLRYVRERKQSIECTAELPSNEIFHVVVENVVAKKAITVHNLGAC